jgi:IS30 family transposase
MNDYVRWRDPLGKYHRLKQPAKFRKLTEPQVAEISRLHAAGMSGAQIARQIGCGPSAVYRALAGRRKGTRPIWT